MRFFNISILHKNCIIIFTVFSWYIRTYVCACYMLKYKDIELLRNEVSLHSYIAYQKYRQIAKYDHMFPNIIEVTPHTIFFISLTVIKNIN